MVLGLMFISAVPVVTGVSLGVREQKKANREAANETRMQKFHLDAYSECAEIDGMQVVLRDEKVYLAPQSSVGDDKAGHPFTGFYIPYPHPDEDHELHRARGLVSTVSVDPPMLNWLYADKDSGRLRCGNRSQSCTNVFAPWDWTEGEEGLTLEGWEGFVAVEEKKGVWTLYFDRADDGLDEIQEVQGRRKMLCSLERRVLPEEKAGG